MNDKEPSETPGSGLPLYPDRPPSPPTDELDDAGLGAELGDGGGADERQPSLVNDDDDDRPVRRGAGEGPPWPMIIGILVVIALAGILAFLLSGNTDDDAESPPDDTAALDTPGPQTTATVPEDFTQFTDEVTGLSLAYPSNWDQLTPPAEDPTVRLVVSAGGLDSLLVRVVALEDPVTRGSMSDLNTLTDGIIGGAGIQLINERTLEINGMPGFQYLYLFDEPTSGEQGVHSHYFLFKERVMYIIVFQVVPGEDFQSFAPTFDAIQATIEGNPPDTLPTDTTQPPEDTTTTTGG